MDAILDYLLKNIKKISGTFLEALIVFIILLLVVASNIEINNTIKNILIIICILTLFIIYILQIVFSKKIPHSNKKTDILIRIITENENDYNEFYKKFINELIIYTKNKTSKFKYLVIPYKAAKNSLKYSNDILFKKSNCILLLDIKINSKKIDSNIDYIIDFNFSFDKSKYKRRIKKRIKFELKYLTQNISNYNYSNHNILDTYNILINQIYNISFYLYIKLHLYLNGKYDDTIENRRYTYIFNK